ncbi:MAG: hypothetical protein ACRDWY_12870, partial [Actinomycetes bacterium]
AEAAEAIAAEAAERVAAEAAARAAEQASRAAAAEQARAASLLTELNREVPAQRKADPRPEPEPTVDPTDSVAADSPIEDGPAPLVERDQADTAMLLRELSSLGFGADDDRAVPPTAPAPRPLPANPAADPKRKRKGLFGRG